LCSQPLLRDFCGVSDGSAQFGAAGGERVVRDPRDAALIPNRIVTKRERVYTTIGGLARCESGGGLTSLPILALLYLDAFYRIDINTRPSRLDSRTWMLEASGLFERAPAHARRPDGLPRGDAADHVELHLQ
jgi:hypothetical protein